MASRIVLAGKEGRGTHVLGVNQELETLISQEAFDLALNCRLVLWLRYYRDRGITA
jgi:hypothetical protein